MAASFNCSMCGATLTAPTKDLVVTLMLTHLRDHHGIMKVSRPELVKLESSIRSESLRSVHSGQT